MKRLLAVTEPGPNDALVAITADHLARVYGAELTFARFVRDDAPDSVLQTETEYIDQLRGLCIGETAACVARGRSEVEAIASLTSEYDLLVLSSPDIRFWTQLRGSRTDRLMRRAACAVLRLKAPRQLTERTLRPDLTDEERVDIDDFLVGECVEARLHVKSKHALFQHLARTFAQAIDGVSAQAIEDALWERERAQNTAIERGMAIPHATIPGAGRSYVGVFTTTEPVDYRAPDNVPVDVFVVTVGPASQRNTHLRILSTLARLVTKTLFLERVRAADNSRELMAVLLASSTLDPERGSDAKYTPTSPAEGDARTDEPDGGGDQPDAGRDEGEPKGEELG